MCDQKHNGWENYETWVTVLWCEEQHQKYIDKLVERAKAQPTDEQEYYFANKLENWIKDQNPLISEANIFSDLVSSALSKINWREVTKYFLTSN